MHGHTYSSKEKIRKILLAPLDMMLYNMYGHAYSHKIE